MSENFDRDLHIDTLTSGLFLALLLLLINSACFAQKKSIPYVLPPMPVKETRQLGFIEDPTNFPEEKMDFPWPQVPLNQPGLPLIKIIRASRPGGGMRNLASSYIGARRQRVKVAIGMHAAHRRLDENKWSGHIRQQGLEKVWRGRSGY